MTDGWRMTRGSGGLWKISLVLEGREMGKVETGSLMGAAGLVSTTPNPLGALLPCFCPMTGCLGETALLQRNAVPSKAYLMVL